MDIQTKGIAMNISHISILASIIVLAGITLFLIIIIVGIRGKEMPINKTLFAIGLLIVGAAVVLLLMDVIESGVAAVIGIVGIGLIATSGRSNIKRMS
jgi:tellurite resistance protein TehA-like permease